MEAGVLAEAQKSLSILFLQKPDAVKKFAAATTFSVNNDNDANDADDANNNGDNF